jgi:quercetin dioxygenase-like cupin family protein
MAKIDTVPLAMKRLVTYQDEAIVSRTLLSRKGGTATIFAFDQSQALSEHTTPYDALIIAVDGKANILISGNSYSVEEGQMITLPANEPHAINALTRFTMLLVMIRK